MGKGKEKPTIQDARLTLKLYELRRESVMRESRNTMNGKFWPRGYEEFIEITRPEHGMNAAFRQVSSYWEMVYGMARHGIAHADYLAENNGEGLLLFAKIHPYLERFRKDYSPLAFQHVEWMVENSDEAKRRFELMQKRVQDRLRNK